MSIRQHWRCVVRPPKAREKHLMIEMLPPTGSRHKGRRISSFTNDPTKAQQLASAREAELNGCVIARGGTFLDMWDAYTANQKALYPDLSLNTIRGWDHIRLCWGPHVGTAAVKDISEATLYKLRDSLVAQPLAPSTINSHFSMVRSAWEWGRRRGFVSFDMPNVDRLPRQNTNKRPFTNEECSQILRASLEFADGRWYSVLRFLYETGCRVGEACELRERDVDRSNGVQVDDVSWFPVRLSGRKTRSPRTVVIEADMLKLMPVREPEDFVFQGPGNRWGTKPHPLTREAVYDAFRKICKVAGIVRDGSIDTHSFRRMWAQDATAIPDLAPTVAKNFLGHKSLNVFMKYQEKAKREMAPVAAKVRAYRASLSPSTSDAPPVVSERAPNPKTSGPAATRYRNPDQLSVEAVRASAKAASPDDPAEHSGTQGSLGEGNSVAQLVAGLSPAERKALIAELLRTSER